MKNLAPLVVFAFNRIESLRSCISSLLDNSEAKDTDLFVFVDGPRGNKDGDVNKIKSVRKFVMGISGFKSLSYKFSDINKGLGVSIIDGVSEVLNQYGKAIVVEDDLVLAPNFISFMNQGLEKYKDEKKVFSICGYSNKIRVPIGYMGDTYFCTRSSSWGWATWIDRWNLIDWQLAEWANQRRNKEKFCKWGGSDCWKLLNDWHLGRNQSWAIRFCYSQFLNNALSLFPIISKVENYGFDGEGTNCKSWSRFKCEFDMSGNKKFIFPDEVILN